MATGTPKNRLSQETSPYLLQHAHNPVDWYPWGPEALARARTLQRPILLSIGYAACHWCHVMERESFEDVAIAELMNAHFVCIKVDREERPDLDDIYMSATIAMSGSGGWPMTVFLTPDGRPFFAGTYFPPTDRYGRPGFPTVLRRIRELWESERRALEDQADALTAHLREQARPLLPKPPELDVVRGAKEHLWREFDTALGGFGGAPKFPPSAALGLLIDDYAETADRKALEMITTTLTAMKNGGIYDQIGGGFARYSTDAEWHVPHFEKMLYDNAQLARIYTRAYQVTQDPEYQRIAAETLDYVLREMQSPEGGYYSATDADSEGVEGKFFVFDRATIVDLLGPEDAAIFCEYYDISEAGNWEETNVLRTPEPLTAVAVRHGLDLERLRAELRSWRDRVYQARKTRIPPLLDDKILTSWNALMIGAMAEASRVLLEPRYLESAERAASFLFERLRDARGRLLRTARGERAHLDGYLEDHSFLADALIELYQASGDPRWLDWASDLCQTILSDFRAPDGALYNTAQNHEALIVRVREGHDGAIPNASAVAARALTRLSRHLDRTSFREAATLVVHAYGQAMTRMPRAYATMIGALLELERPGPEWVLTGSPEGPTFMAFRRALAENYVPRALIGLAHPAAEKLPLFAAKTAVHGQATLYVCRGYACSAPLTDPAQANSATLNAPP